MYEKKKPPGETSTGIKNGAEGGNRTPTSERSLDPEPSASTSSATSAKIINMILEQYLLSSEMERAMPFFPVLAVVSLEPEHGYLF